MRITFIVIALLFYSLLGQTTAVNKTNYPDNCPEVLEEPYSLVHSKWFYTERSEVHRTKRGDKPIPVKYALKYQTKP